MGGLSWFGIFRLGLVQTALGAIVVLATSTLNRVMVVELALPAMIPGALVGLHYAVQILRPRWGYGSDTGGRRTPWILGGIAVLALSALGAAAATALMGAHPVLGTLAAVIAFVGIGVGVGAAGTSLLALLAVSVAPRRKAAAGAIVWLMMIAGFVITAKSAAGFLDPYTHLRLIAVTAVAGAGAMALATLAVWRLEGARPGSAARRATRAQQPFMTALAEVWADPKARVFAVFVFASMLAYSAQDLILEPFAGHVFGLTPGESTALAGTQHQGVFLGMVLVGVCVSGLKIGTARIWTVGGCLASALALAVLVLAGLNRTGLEPAVFALGVANGTFAVAAIGAMMGLASEGQEAREGTRMGLWGAAQAIAFGIGGFAGAAAADLTRSLIADPAVAYGLVFAAEAGLFIISAGLALRVAAPGPRAALVPGE